MLESVDIGFLNPNHDLCYYAMGAFPPFRSRDFVLQRAWLDLGAEKILCTHSVCHKVSIFISAFLELFTVCPAKTC
jgi:hypothetical protein